MSLNDYFKNIGKQKIINEFDDLNKKINSLKEENDKWEKDFNKLIKLRDEANFLEKSGKLEDSIKKYLEAIEFGENSSRLKINNFLFDIKRVIILYGKTKQKDELKAFLQNVIDLFPDSIDLPDWKLRLLKCK